MARCLAVSTSLGNIPKSKSAKQIPGTLARSEILGELLVDAVLSEAWRLIHVSDAVMAKCARIGAAA